MASNYNKRLFFILATLVCFLSSCASTPTEEYIDYFYANQDEQGIKGFKYILSVKGSQYNQSEEMGNRLITDPKHQESNRRQSRSKNSSDDGYSSNSFRMEEEAFKRLDKIVIDKNFCHGEIEYLENEYTWLKYSIIGRCKVHN